MKKFFYGATYLLLLVMMFTYLLISKEFNLEYESLLGKVSETGISVIGFLFIFPAFIFTILALCGNKKMVAFCRDMFALFASAFSVATGVIGLFTFAPYYYVPVILLVASGIVFILSLINVIKGLKSEKQAQ